MKIQPSSVGNEFSLFGLVHLLWCHELLGWGDVELEVLDSVEHFTVIRGEASSSDPLLLELAASHYSLSRLGCLGHVHEDVVPVILTGLEEGLLQPVKVPAFVSGALSDLFLGHNVPWLVVLVHVTSFFHSTGIHDHLVHLLAEHVPVGLSHDHELLAKLLISDQVLSTVLNTLVPVGVLAYSWVRHLDADIHSPGLPVVDQLHVSGHGVGVLLHVGLEKPHEVVVAGSSLGVLHATLVISMSLSDDSLRKINFTF